MKAYLFSFNNVIQTNAVHKILNGTNAVEYWVTPIPNTAILISKLSVAELSAVLHTHLGDVWFILAEATPQNTNGWLPGNFWEHISNPDKAAGQNLLQYSGAIF